MKLNFGIGVPNDAELEKMKAGGNAKFQEFLESQEDYDPGWSLQEKYNSKAAALFRDKVRTSCPAHQGLCGSGSRAPEGPASPCAVRPRAGQMGLPAAWGALRPCG